MTERLTPQPETSSYTLDDLTDDELLERLHPSVLDSFIRLPSDPATPLMPPQLDALFPPGSRAAVLREIAALALQRNASAEVDHVA